MLAEMVRQVAAECGFELAGVASAEPLPADIAKYDAWCEAGYAGEMRYLTDRRRFVRHDPKELLPTARSILCVGKLYNTGEVEQDSSHAQIARYARGLDYHDTMRADLKRMLARLRELAPEPFDAKICVDTAPLLERSYARMAGLGWIGKNTSLINQQQGSWFLLGEIVTSLEIDPATPPPDRCGTCTRCIDACPTDAIVPVPPGNGNEWTIDSRLCISYLTIELHGEIPAELHAGIGDNLFGCDICQEVCPWNDPERIPVTTDESFDREPLRLSELAEMDEARFRERFGKTPVSRAKFSGLKRNLGVVLENLRRA